MNTLAAVINSLMREKNISVTELARQTQICQPVLHRLSTGVTYNPQIETLVPIARFFAVSIDQLIGRAPLPDTSHITTPQYWASLPLLALDQIVDWLDSPALIIPTERISTDSPVSKNSYAIQLNDSTMQPRFTEKTVFIINPSCSAEDQDFVVAEVPGQKAATFKQFIADGETHYLKSLNPDFPVIKMTKEYRILGTMVQARIDYGKKNAPR